MKVPFDIAKAIPAAWNLLWSDNICKRDEGRDFRGNTYYVTARDVELQVRQFAAETVAGERWGTRGRAWGSPYVSVRIAGDLNNMVRQWLLGNHNITGHNFGRGHISGMRFRPRGAPLGPSEIKTMKEKANPKPRPIHYNPNGYGFPRCTQARRSVYSRGWRPTARVDNDQSKVTCKRCLNLLAMQHPEGVV